MFLEQQKSDQLSERRIEESLTGENEKLKAQLTATLKELANLKSVHDQHELLLKQTSSSMPAYEQRINELQIMTTELMTAKVGFRFRCTKFISRLVAQAILIARIIAFSTHHSHTNRSYKSFSLIALTNHFLII